MAKVLTKERLIQYNYNNPPRIFLGRRQDVQERYEQMSRKEKELFIQKVATSLICKSYFIIENDFPYNVEPGIKHLLLFSNNPAIFNTIRIMYRDKLITYWVNMPDNCSIKLIPHAHIFINCD